MSFSNYGVLCTAFYDHTKQVGQSFGGEIAYYQDRLKTCEGRILEAMAGSGRVLIPLLESGLIVDGVDYSTHMLASCRQRCEEWGLFPRLYTSSLEELSLPEKYEAIIIPGGSFLLIEQREASIKALQRLYDHLLPGGRLLLDLFLPETNFECGNYRGTSTVSLENGDIITLEEKMVEADFYNQYTVSHLKYEKWREGVLIQTELQRFALRWYGVAEFKLVLESIGFVDVVVSADFKHGQAPTNSQQKYVYEAIRP